MRFLGKLEYLTPKILKNRPQKLSYYRVTVVTDDGVVENLALTPVEYRKAKKRASQGKLYIKPNLFMKIYAALAAIFGTSYGKPSKNQRRG
tara:strand:- start:10963 stop:11235 length:273 start_codon:yes stop_codon:yes gene_type:complete